MKNKPLIIMVAIMAGPFLSCQSAPTYSRPLNAKLLHLVNDAVFEVVLEKPVDEQIVYEKEIDWNFVPFAMRNDKYHSIGTAFVVSKTEMITAFQRDGLVLGTVPEDDSGHWNLLKSSANSSPGNSGGHLVTPNGKVVVLVTDTLNVNNRTA
jgi:hypothetical protein